MDNLSLLTKVIVFGPLLGALIGGFGWRLISERGAMVVTTGLLFLSAALSWMIFLGLPQGVHHIHVLDFIQSGTLDTSWAIRLDRLTAIMLIVITTVSALVHLYSWGYMAHDENWHHGESYKPRFFAYLSFFTFAMLMLVTADNLVQMFFGWEGVGVASYLLIGFYYRKPSANAAAIKAFVVNRVGDFGFALGIFGLFYLTGSIKMDDIFAAAPQLAQTQLHFLWTEWNAANLLAFLLFVGAMGKSAQLFLHTWLPDAMEGPTPVSALIHAATMVTAGVFLVCRMSPLFEVAPEAKMFVVYIGAMTAFFAATVGLVQNDIKRVIAYSTCSQLGYMFVAAGVGMYSVAMFHLLTHAFFKAMLFLGAGSVIHATHHEQDMRNYGGLRKKIPFTFWMMLIGTLAITGVGIPLTAIGFAGFLSKDAIIESAHASGIGFAFWALVIAAMFTSFYSWRLMFLTFWGERRHAHDAHDHGHAHEAHDDHAHDAHEPHESPAVMLIPLAVLAVGAVFSGMAFYKPFFGDHATMANFFGMGHAAPHVAAEAPAAIPAPPIDGPMIVNPSVLPPALDMSDVQHGMGGLVVPMEGHGTPMHGMEGPAMGGHEMPGHGGPDMGHGPMLHAGDAVVTHQGAITMSEASNKVMDDAHHSPAWVKVSPFVAMLIGLVTAWVMYIRSPSLPARIAAANRPLYQFLLNKWYFDEIYDFFIVRPAKWLGNFLWKRGDGSVIDGAINGVALGVIPAFNRATARAQSGYVFHYALAMVLGIAGLLLWMTLSGGAK